MNKKDTELEYTLTCDNCGELFYSKEAFPSPLLCAECSLVEKIAELYWLQYRDVCSSWFWDMEWLELKPKVDVESSTHTKQCYAFAKQVQALIPDEKEIRKAVEAEVEEGFGKHYAESYQEAHREIVEAEVKEARKEGIREVVEWGNEYCPHHEHDRPKRFCEFCWLSQLKVWEMGW